MNDSSYLRAINNSSASINQIELITPISNHRLILRLLIFDFLFEIFKKQLNKLPWFKSHERNFVFDLKIRTYTSFQVNKM